jgi:hypothetical protein
VKRPILNYTTSVPVGKTVAEISQMLVEHGAQSLLLEYNAQREPCAISFRIQTQYGLIAFRLPSRVNQVGRLLAAERRRQRNPQANHEKAARVGWRVLKDWVAAQLALIKAEMVGLEEVFLPYALDHQGQTFFERAKAARFAGMLLEDEKKP